MESDEVEIERLQALIRIPTVSKADAGDTDWAAFAAFHAELAQQFPLVFTRLEAETVLEHTLLLRWPGADVAAAPVVLMAHQDVVDPGDAAAWTHPPFAAEIVADDGVPTLHGRGAIDDKGALCALLSGVEAALEAGHAPRRDVWLVFTHDEETHSTGARAAVARFRERGIRAAWVLDEGGAIVSEFLPGVAADLAAIGVSEKGTLSVRLTVDEQGGHASTPPRTSAIGRLARAVARIDARPFPSRLTPALRRLFAHAGAGGRGLLPLLYRNVAMTAPILRRALIASGPEGEAMTRTTRVATLVRGGHAENAIPEHAEAIVNVRLLPGDTAERALEHLRRAVADPLVRVEGFDVVEASPVSPDSGPGWDELVSALAATIPDAIPVPYQQTGATDGGRFFSAITDRVYRFAPFRMSTGEREALHAMNERIRVSAYLEGVACYEALVRAL